jgi:hypothetical protein
MRMEIDNNFSIRTTTVNGFKRYTVNLNLLHDLIKEKVNEFFSHYNCKPKYVKVPSWLVVILKRFADNPACFTISNVGHKYKPDTLFGLEICETIAIEHVGDIEVF